MRKRLLVALAAATAALTTAAVAVAATVVVHPGDMDGLQSYTTRRPPRRGWSPS